MVFFFMHAATWWTTSRLGFSTIMQEMEFHSQPASPWRCTPAYGTPMTGRRKVAEWRRIGLRLLSPPLTGITTPTPVLWVFQAIPVMEIWTARHGKHRDWMAMGGTESDGSNRSTWSTTIVLMLKGFLRGFLGNANFQGFRPSKLDTIFPGHRGWWWWSSSPFFLLDSYIFSFKLEDNLK